MNLGIIGAGHIARKMTDTLKQVPQICVKAVASRTWEKANAFAQEKGVERAYGSYDEVIQDPDIQLLYIATPHSHHYAPTKAALLAGKACLVEKAFMMNARETEEVIRISQERNVYLAEAIWTRYMPISFTIKEILQSGAIGEPKMMHASLTYKIDHKERVMKPELGGGALLDLGVYALNFARMYFGTDITRVVSNSVLSPSGVDVQESISLTYSGGRLANLQCGALSLCDRQGVISGSDGYLVVDNINNPTRVDVYRGFDHTATYTRPEGVVTGYEYQVLEAKRCIEQGLCQTPMMPHDEILAIMKMMDELRLEWNMKID